MTSTESGIDRGESILDEIRSILSSHPHTSALDGPDYMRCHTAFEGAGNQQAKILEYLTNELQAASRGDLSIASIGAGSGVLDIPLLKAVCTSKRVDYTVVEPMIEQCEQFATLASSRLNADNRKISYESKVLRDLSHESSYDSSSRSTACTTWTSWTPRSTGCSHFAKRPARSSSRWHRLGG